MMAATRPNIVLILADDLGYSDIGCYGAEIETPNLDALARGGLRFSQFYNTARCSPSRASLLTGLHPHQTGVGILTHNDGPEGYPGTLNAQCATLPEVLGPSGYRCYMSGKWHLSSRFNEGPISEWPLGRGFHRFYGTIHGAGSYFHPRTLWRDHAWAGNDVFDPEFYYTDAISTAAAEFIAGHDSEDPFFLYVAYTAPHWPLHALPEDIARYKGKYSEGWDALRKQRHQRLLESGVLSPEWTMTDRDPAVPAWEAVEDKHWEQSRMEVYAAQIGRMDQGIGRIVRQLSDRGMLNDTIIIFLSDNGGCAEEIYEGDGMNYAGPTRRSAQLWTRTGKQVRFGNVPENVPGPEDGYLSYGRSWANLSNTPFREYKHWVHEGGIATPFIVHWPSAISDAGGIRHSPFQLTDVMPTLLEAAGAAYPGELAGRPVTPLEGISMRKCIAGDQDTVHRLFWEHEGNAAVRHAQWKLVRKYPGDWELSDVNVDRTELTDVAGKYPEVVAELAQAYVNWAARCGVIPREKILGLKK